MTNLRGFMLGRHGRLSPFISVQPVQVDICRAASPGGDAAVIVAYRR